MDCNYAMHAYIRLFTSSLPTNNIAQNIISQARFRLVASNGGLDILRLRSDAQTLLCQAHLTCEGGVWYPCGAVPSIDFLHHLINLLERQTLGFGNEEVGEGGGDAAEGAPEEEDFGAEVGVAFGGTD